MPAAIGPDTIAGLGVSLNIVFAVIAGGMWTLLGPTFGAVFTQVLAEVLRVGIQSSETLKSILGSSALALDTLIYALLLVLFIIYMPKGILGHRAREVARHQASLECAAAQGREGHGHIALSHARIRARRACCSSGR